MAYPTLTCKITNVYFAGVSSEPVFTQFNQVRVSTASGVWSGTFVCDPALSTFLPSQSSIIPLTGAEYGELWPLLVGMIMAGCCVRVLLRVFAE